MNYDLDHQANELADEWAREQLGCELEDLPPEVVCVMFNRAWCELVQREVSRIEALEDR